MQESNFSKIGLKCGIEIHQQLDTNKLFCSCPSQIRDDEPDQTIRRRIKAVAGELGEVDPAALHELLRDQEFVYEFYEDANCLVELDEEPPHPLNEHALEVALEVALLLSAKPVDEIQVMRKTVIDGSNTSGFQRTMLVATDGWVEVNKKKIRIPTICLEEDAARIIKKEGNRAYYRLDRLGIPLVEIGTDPDITSPEEARATAERLGMILRATGKVKRGLGTIRQDLNVSIADGERIEIKGVQNLKDIPGLVRNEVMRQATLVSIRKDLSKRGAKEADLILEIKDLSQILSKTKSKILKNAPGIYGLRLRWFKGLLGRELMPGYRFGTELARIVNAAVGLKGIIHSDELPGYGMTEKEMECIRKELKTSDEDGYVLIVADWEDSRRALQAVLERCKVALKGVPKEVRRALGERTEYMRPLPGSARMYPETDEPVVQISKQALDRVGGGLSLLPEEHKEELKKLGLGDELVNQLIKSRFLNDFKRMNEKFDLKPSIVASALLSAPQGVGTERVEEVLSLLAQKRIAKESIADIFEEMKSGGKTVEKIAKEKDLFLLDEKELQERISRILGENKELAQKKQIGPLMGKIMAELRGKADVEDVKRILGGRL
ncbi:MAG: Glu-tRNA(Gln) amidotransferase subunit GatE [Candidatus Altiarchaeota archaeon]|nr:Glu-tRNA(Gln) amidotransferase subunit GatE [Candidatus Altiarchaeota archaeon]